jgi:hypothetical protein
MKKKWEKEEEREMFNRWIGYQLSHAVQNLIKLNF